MYCVCLLFDKIPETKMPRINRDPIYKLIPDGNWMPSELEQIRKGR